MVTNGECMNHGFEAHIHFTTSDDLGHIGRIIRFQDGHFDALIFEVTFGSGQIQRNVVRRRVP